MPEYEIEKNVYLYNQAKEVWYQLKPLPSKHKICNAVHNGNGRFYLFLLDHSKSNLPMCLNYDLKTVCPKLDRYWYHDYAKKVQEAKKEQQTMDIFINDRMGGKRNKYDDPDQKAMESRQS